MSMSARTRGGVVIIRIPPLRRLQAVDAAKKRAVSQHVDYDTFKNMVSHSIGDNARRSASALRAFLLRDGRTHNKGVGFRWMQVLTAHLKPIQAASAPRSG
jgi:hypothetical protein